MRLKEVSLDTKGLTIEEAQSFGGGLAEMQRACNWQIGDLAIYARYGLRLGDNYSQVFPEWMSPGLIQRCEAVSKAYKPEERNINATWTQHMKVASHPDRVSLVAAMVDAGETSDESQRVSVKPDRWILAIDVNYYLHRFWFSGAGLEAATSLAGWIHRLTERLKEKGLTDVLCCFDDRTNHRKQLTENWEDKYKDRPPKDPELGQQLTSVKDLLVGHGFACASLEGMEGDDIMASVAKSFDGRVTLLTQDKDCRQCLSANCNMLLDVLWDEETGPQYNWLSAKEHTEATGIPPALWTDYQMLMGDNVDGIRGAVGIGEKGAAELIQTFGSVEAAIQAAKDEDERIKPKKREALIEFEAKMDVTRQLVTLRTDLELPTNTRV